MSTTAKFGKKSVGCRAKLKMVFALEMVESWSRGGSRSENTLGVSDLDQRELLALFPLYS